MKKIILKTDQELREMGDRSSDLSKVLTPKIWATKIIELT